MRILLLHGAYTRPWHWHLLAAVLEEAGHEVIVPDLPVDGAAAGVEEYLAAAEGALGEGTEDPVVVGSSMGGLTATLLAARRPVRALVTINALIPRPGHAMAEEIAEFGFAANADAFVYDEHGTSTFIEHRAIEIAMHDCDPELAREAAARLRPQAAKPFLEPSPLDGLPTVPALGIVSRGDHLVNPEWAARAVRERLGVEPSILEGDHMPMMSRPRELARTMLAQLPS